MHRTRNYSKRAIGRALAINHKTVAKVIQEYESSLVSSDPEGSLGILLTRKPVYDSSSRHQLDIGCDSGILSVELAMKCPKLKIHTSYMFRKDQIEKHINKTLIEYFTSKNFVFKDANNCTYIQNTFIDAITFRVVEIGLDFGIICYFTRSYDIIEVELNRLIKEFGLKEMDYTIWIELSQKK